jgi:cell division protein FtsQ
MPSSYTRQKPATRRIGFGVRLSLLAGSAIVIIGFAIWLLHSGWLERKAEEIKTASLQLTQKAHFAVHDIIVKGRQHTEKTDLFAALGVSEGTPIFAFDPAEAYTRIRALPWIASAVVERRLPDTIIVNLTERVPAARWQHDNQTVVIDSEGKELTGTKPEAFPNLPLVVGLGAPAQTQALQRALAAFPTIATAVKAAVRVSERRWDLHLQPNVIARMPEQNMEAALARLAKLIQEQKVLERNVVAVDLRLPDREFIEPGASSPPSTPTKELHK